MAVFQVRKNPVIEINGHEFSLRMSEADIIERGLSLKEMADNIVNAENQTTANLLHVCRAVEKFINDLCGDGAMDTMVDGVVLSVIDTIHLLGVVNEEATKAFNAALVEKHE